MKRIVNQFCWDSIIGSLNQELKTLFCNRTWSVIHCRWRFPHRVPSVSSATWDSRVMFKPSSVQLVHSQHLLWLGSGCFQTSAPVISNDSYTTFCLHRTLTVHNIRFCCSRNDYSLLWHSYWQYTVYPFYQFRFQLPRSHEEIVAFINITLPIRLPRPEDCSDEALHPGLIPKT